MPTEMTAESRLAPSERIDALESKLDRLLEAAKASKTMLSCLSTLLEYQKMLDARLCSIEQKIDKIANAKDMSRIFGKYLLAAFQHQKTFSEFKYKHRENSIVIMGCGPSVNKLKRSFFDEIENPIYIGINRAFMHPFVKFDYTFIIDGWCASSYIDKFFAYEHGIKFVGDQDFMYDPVVADGARHQISEVRCADPSIRRYKTTSSLPVHLFPIDLEVAPIVNCSSTSLQAMQFALYTLPKRIYLLGMDCTERGHFTDSKLSDGRQVREVGTDFVYPTIEDWHKIKRHVDTYYREIDVISVNPVGLKGLFRDIYTD